MLEAELPIYEKVYAAARTRGDAHEAALQQVLAALLMNPQFLHRMEFSTGLGGTQPVAAYELATRLSYLL